MPRFAAKPVERGLPNSCDAIRVKLRVVTDNRCVFVERLRNEHSVEGISVMEGVRAEQEVHSMYSLKSSSGASKSGAIQCFVSLAEPS